MSRAWLAAIALLASSAATSAQDKLPEVSVSGNSSAPVEKSYRRMVQGMDYFERMKASLAPQALLRFKLLPRKPGTDMDHIELDVDGKSFDEDVPIAADHTFVLKRDPRAMAEDAQVSTNRRKLSMTWRAEVRTPGWPAGTRRLGDLRLECQVGMEAGLISNNSPLDRIAEMLTDSRRYCEKLQPLYLFFTDRPLFSVTLVDGARREVLPIDRLYAGASDDPMLRHDLPDCDCEVLEDRSYFLPLGDHGWPDDTRVEFEMMDGGPP